MEKSKITSLFDKVEEFVDLYITELGKEKCQPVKRPTYIPRDYYVLHYVFNGKGTYIIDHNRYQLKTGDFFLIPPNKEVTYYPSQNNPWTYAWVGFNGIKAKKFLDWANLSETNPVCSYNKDNFFVEHFSKMVDALNHFGYIDISCLGYLYIILSRLIENNRKEEIEIGLTKKQSNVREAVLFMKCNYPSDIKIKDVADSLFMNPNYLANIFQEVLNESPKQYLTRIRIEKACELLCQKDMKINEVARNVGYKDPLHFSREFKKIMKISPSEFVKSNRLNG